MNPPAPKRRAPSPGEFITIIVTFMRNLFHASVVFGRIEIVASHFGIYLVGGNEYPLIQGVRNTNCSVSLFRTVLTTF